jgi:PAS domain S-box-containing protein
MKIKFGSLKERAMEEGSATTLASVLLLSRGYKVVVDCIPDAAWLKDKRGRYAHVNERFLCLHGLSLDAVIGKEDREVFPPDMAEIYAGNDGEAIGAGAAKGFAEPMRTADGRRVTIEAIRTPVYDDTRELLGTAGIGRVTGNGDGKGLFDEQKRPASETAYRTIFDKATVGIFQSTPEGRILNLNPASARMLGYDSPEEMINTIKDTGRQLYVSQDDRQRLLRLAEENEAVEGFETRFYKKDGNIVHVLLNFDCIKDGGGRIAGFEGTILDITETRKAEGALRQAEEMYRNIYENAIEGIFRTTPDGLLIDANPAFARILGYDDPKELAASVTDIGRQVFASERRRKEYMDLMATRGVVRDFETQVRCKDGSTQWVSVNSRSTGGDEGNPLYHEGTIESITERKQLETQLRHAQKMESIGTLAGGVAHDFNNVLTTVMGYCSLIMMKAGDKHPYAGYVNQIMEAANRASALTQSLLAFSRKQAWEVKPVDINETIRGVEKLLRRVIGEDIELETLLGKERLIVMVGDGHISQLLMNLATNARDAMPDGGVLTIRTEAAHLSGDLVGTHLGREGTYAALEMSDTGTGMDERTKDQIFDPFFTTKEVGKGTGLGLSVVYGIVNQNKGYLNVSSVPGKGTTFTVYFPLAEASADEEAPLERARLRGGKEVILVAEDNAQVREIVTTTLRDFGYTVIEACDGSDAIGKFNENRAAIDLLLLDVIMPRKNGKEAYTEVKKVRPDVRAIFMSGYTGDILSRKGISREGIPMISKPIVIERLLRVIREVLDNKPSQLSLFP